MVYRVFYRGVLLVANSLKELGEKMAEVRKD